MGLPKSLTRVTPFSKILALILFIVFPLVGFLMGMQYQKTVDMVTLLHLGINPVPSRTIIVSLADNNKIVSANVGDKIMVMLGDANNWTITSSDASVLQTTGTTGEFAALKSGTAVISANGRPNCAHGHLCPMILITFRTTVDVSK